MKRLFRSSKKMESSKITTIEDIEVGGKPPPAEQTMSVGELHTFAHLVSENVGAALMPKLDALERRLNDVELQTKQVGAQEAHDVNLRARDSEEVQSSIAGVHSDVDVTAVTPEERAENDALFANHFAHHVIDNDDNDTQFLQSQRLILLFTAYVCGLFVGVSAARMARR